MWDLPWWKENVTNDLPSDLRGKTARETAWNKAKRQGEYDVVCFGGDENLWYTLFLFLLGKKTAAVMGEMFLPEFRPGLKWKLKRALRRFLYRNVDRFVVYSSEERRLWSEYLGYDPSRFATVLFASNILDPSRHPEGLYLPEGDYGFAAGRSGRDYRTFFEAVKDLPYPFVVVSDKASVEGLEIPENVTLHCDIPWSKYLELLEKSAFTVVPLHDWQRSIGQVVILEGYAFGKPTVATRCIGTTDYVVEGETGFLTPPYQAAAMKDSIRQLIDSGENRARMGKAALEEVRRRFSPQAYLDRYRNVLEEAVRSYENTRAKR